MVLGAAFLALVGPIAGWPVAGALIEEIATDRRVVRPRQLDATTPGGGLQPPPFAALSPASPNYQDHPNHSSRRAEPALELLRDDPLRRVCGLLRDKVGVGLDSHREDCVLPLVDSGELVDVAVELDEAV